ncbi:MULTISPECIES: hypothetical protein [Stenotrophomonas]|uniref:Uncharacterized protein n=1 Tax=Stenotrophomonas pavanii TaxID=487698 RepID=A0A246KWQ2_9GAMM|nr:MULTISPECIES: hypothetical protein [Stenotrophomonas]MBC9080430.1 hypothetical protein [Stenotrophomonas maltophilia]MBC9093637.1 hypothetical protein [Stenotrophomonas maltophilia]MBH1521097.1 hypothetical protein [Stenotrophomonas maltophilia]MBN4943088.1 hypothetical protein [Stenotrophomonas maltophilia]MBN5059761.1 hypothetical protein [Stenotrophomonas maltophilia]
MQPRKTDLARTALQAHRAPLDMRQRRLLILCDGQRTLADLTGLIGQDAAAMVIQLVQAGYLSTGTAATTAPPPPAAAAAPAPATPAAAPAAPATGSERRRSLVAARIYVLGILEMQRHPQAAALFRELQQARAESDVLQVLQSAMRTLPGLASEGYCQRVRQRLLEALPLEHCDAFAEVA